MHDACDVKQSVEVRQLRSQASSDAVSDEIRRYNLEELQPGEVFELLLNSQRPNDDEAQRSSLVNAFEVVRNADDDALNALLPKSIRIDVDPEVNP